MKKIKISCIMDKDNASIRTNLKRYKIFLAWGTTNLFKDKKKAAKYQVKLNLWINDTFYELNNVYAKILYQYRRSWLFMEADIDDRMKANLNNIEISIHRLFRSELRADNSIFWALQEIERLCAHLKKCLIDLSEYYYKKQYWEHVREINIIVRELNRILKELQENTDPGDLGQPLRRED